VGHYLAFETAGSGTQLKFAASSKDPLPLVASHLGMRAERAGAQWWRIRGLALCGDDLRRSNTLLDVVSYYFASDNGTSRACPPSR
jgi:hypothetical protein